MTPFMPERPVIIVADDHPMFRSAVSSGLRQHFPDAIMSGMGSMEELRPRLQGNPIDLLLLDLDIPGARGLSGLLEVVTVAPSVRTAILSATVSTPIVSRALAIGARAYIPKSLELTDIVGAVRTVLAGRIWVPPDFRAAGVLGDEVSTRLATLSPRQLAILGLIAKGLLNKQIAAAMGVSEQTIKEHVSVILKKTGSTTRTQAALFASGLTATTVPPDVAGPFEDV